MPAHLIAEEGPHRGLVLKLEKGDEWVIGRDPDTSDFLIEDTTVSRKHARLNQTEEGIVIRNLSKINPVLVNDEEHVEPYLLKEGDRIQIGNTIFVYSEGEIPEHAVFPEPTEEPEPPKALTEEDKLLEKLKENIYDTIFDDAVGEEELPFNLVSETPILLKVIAGPNAGAEIGIEKGRTYVMGKDPHLCDVVFQDLSVSRTHARIVVSPEGQIEIEDLGSKNGTVVNGKPINDRIIITPQDLVAMGTTVFLIIDREAPQETIYSPMVPSYEAAKLPAPEEAEFPPPIEEEAPLEKKKDWKSEPIPMKYLVGAGSVIVVFFIVFLSFFSLFKAKSLEIVKKEPTHHIQEALAKFPDVQFSFNPASGKLFLVGHVMTNIEYQELQYAIGQLDFITGTEETVIIDEGVSKTMNDILMINPDWRGVSIRANTPGKFIASGYVQSNATMTQLTEYLNVNFPYLDRLNNQVGVLEMMTTQLQGILNGKGFGAVTVQLTNGEVVLSGVYNQKMEEDYREVVKEMNKIAGVTGVKNLALPTNPSAAAIDLSAQYQVSGSSLFDGKGYSAILNGRIYTLGDRIDGMSITAIEPNTILLEKDGVKYKIDYTGRG